MAGIFHLTGEDEIVQGTPYSLTFVIDDDGVAWDLTGYTFAASIKNRYTDVNSLVDFTAIIVGAATDGRINLSLTATQTMSLFLFGGVWDLEIIDVSSVPFRLLEGSVEVSREVTT